AEYPAGKRSQRTGAHASGKLAASDPRKTIQPSHRPQAGRTDSARARLSRSCLVGAIAKRHLRVCRLWPRVAARKTRRREAMPNWAWIVIGVAAAVLVLALTWAAVAIRRRKHLQERFGPEYER